MSLSKEEKINNLNVLIQEGKNLFVTRSFERQNFSYDPFDDRGPIIEYYSDVDYDRYPIWRIKSLAFLKKILGDHSTYVKEFIENCKSSSSEEYLRQGIGILEAVKSGYENDLILEEEPPNVQTNIPLFHITNINEIKNQVEVEYKVSNFQVLIENIEKSDIKNKEDLVSEVKNIQKELEEGTADWAKIQKWCSFALSLGKDLGINLLANIIAKSAGIA